MAIAPNREMFRGASGECSLIRLFPDASLDSKAKGAYHSKQEQGYGPVQARVVVHEMFVSALQFT